MRPRHRTSLAVDTSISNRQPPGRPHPSRARADAEFDTVLHDAETRRLTDRRRSTESTTPRVPSRRRCQRCGPETAIGRPHGIGTAPSVTGTDRPTWALAAPDQVRRQLPPPHLVAAPVPVAIDACARHNL